MIDIKVEINGKPVAMNKLVDEVHKIAVKRLENWIANTVGSIKCPVHGSYSKIIAQSSDGVNFKFNVSGCCNKLIGLVKGKLKNSK